ncbi:hypothetical protein ASF60_13570 [Methylobacterium sp. Leaf113]|uniref:hypothetical protein n=1 Tax=Methylobacterium sp. Leaf113 TaxID=1736259 RepID=UPI0006F36F34|nr:hypothetical protein [Methylobacterium sp. Leaf113]KQP94128.1 hypothetical protein ASF60_13570 [Methylobacterium sp. Leaf113]
MADAKPDIITWLEKHYPQATSPEARAPLRLYGYQRAIVRAMSDPGVRVVILRPTRDADLPAVGSFHG